MVCFWSRQASQDGAQYRRSAAPLAALRLCNPVDADGGSPLAYQQSQHPVSRDAHLHNKRQESNGHGGGAERQQMDN